MSADVSAPLDASTISVEAARAALAGFIAALALPASLHVLSSEFVPSFRIGQRVCLWPVRLGARAPRRVVRRAAAGGAAAGQR